MTAAYANLFSTIARVAVGGVAVVGVGGLVVDADPAFTDCSD